MDTRKIIGELLRNIGGQKEVQQYLRLYTGGEGPRFAVIRAGDEVLADRKTLSSALAFLQHVGLSPIVVHGAPIEPLLESAGINLSRNEGFMPAPPEALDLIKTAYRDENLALTNAFAEQGAIARPVSIGVFTAAARDEDALGLVGRITHVDVTAIRAAIDVGQVPLVSSMGEAAGGQLLDLSTDEAALAVAEVMEPSKIVFLTADGGVLDKAGKLVTAINLVEDRAHFLPHGLSPSSLAEPIRRRLRRVVTTLDRMPQSTSVSFTSPAQLARELFTHRGAGTLVRRGEMVHRYEDFVDIDQQRLRELLLDCFRRPLADGYFESKDCDAVYVTESYRATAIVTKDDDTIPYLDKFAVTPQAQGEGLGASMWSRLRGDYPRLFWRSRPRNKINRWYFEQADGSFKLPDWTVFWYGLDDFEDVRRCVHTAQSMAATIAPPAARPSST
ncbi:MAG: acetylglutamate kinase [Myxococcota bacterium]